MRLERERGKCQCNGTKSIMVVRLDDEQASVSIMGHYDVPIMMVCLHSEQDKCQFNGNRTMKGTNMSTMENHRNQ